VPEQDDLAAYRCRHGKLFMGCADPDCPEQNAYLGEREAQMAAWEDLQEAAAREAVLTALGIPNE